MSSQDSFMVQNTSTLFEMFVTSSLIPPLAIYWRIRGALQFRVMFL